MGCIRIRRDCMPDATVYAITPYVQYYTYRFLHRVHKNKGNFMTDCKINESPSTLDRFTVNVQ
jgi:hypothetical protein